MLSMMFEGLISVLLCVIVDDLISWLRIGKCTGMNNTRFPMKKVKCLEDTFQGFFE